MSQLGEKGLKMSARTWRGVRGDLLTRFADVIIMTTILELLESPKGTESSSRIIGSSGRLGSGTELAKVIGVHSVIDSSFPRDWPEVCEG
jgi:hypothetical protein